MSDEDRRLADLVAAYDETRKLFGDGPEAWRAARHRVMLTGYAVHHIRLENLTLVKVKK